MTKMTVTEESLSADAATLAGLALSLDRRWNEHMDALALTQDDTGTFTQRMINFYVGYVKATTALNNYVVGKNGAGGGVAALEAFQRALTGSGRSYEAGRQAVDRLVAALPGE